MSWTVLEHPEFAVEREELDSEVAEKLDALILLLEQYGPQLGRPYVDTLSGSGHANMKEMRFKLVVSGDLPLLSMKSAMPSSWLAETSKARTRSDFTKISSPSRIDVLMSG